MASSASTPASTQTPAVTQTPALTMAEARAAYSPSATRYLAACTAGLPTLDTVRALHSDADTWRRGGASPAHYQEEIDRARALYAGLVGVASDRVAIGSQASVMAAVLAASVPAGREVVCVDGDFTSMVFPFLQQEHRGITVRHVPVGELAATVSERTWLVAFSLVQSATGEIADAPAIRAAAAAVGAFTLCDTTQATGWLPVNAAEFDATICHAYKWLGAPRGAAFLTVRPELAELLLPVQAGWFAGEDPWASCYGPTMTLATDARRFDVSPAWPAWVGARVALEFFSTLDAAAVHAHDTGLGNALCAGLGLPQRDQAIITWADPAGTDLARLTAAGITASGRAGRARVAFHLWNDTSDVAEILSALAR
ncbi:aminotransferase class V-fold PLP-dependent enzyme [Cryobacterium sp. 1639]|uniref:aminotransferase class V-fold PLP-dependent enzyme n=1 Tax=Cryobacterium inferilacus TaxID=2866629 RepID=UPI001C73A85F|nr:aminotransferase class V-fold PLP-dependent enzyme [Cryobacterium sp. 1639]MBX0299544.1 aminotransferase class V-fold PLP-dependent enzyme [Cryobacterium sp. 1639]